MLSASHSTNREQLGDDVWYGARERTHTTVSSQPIDTLLPESWARIVPQSLPWLGNILGLRGNCQTVAEFWKSGYDTHIDRPRSIAPTPDPSEDLDSMTVKPTSSMSHV